MDILLTLASKNGKVKSVMKKPSKGSEDVFQLGSGPKRFCFKFEAKNKKICLNQ